MSWAWKPERASECMNGMHVCEEFTCDRIIKRKGRCVRCKKKLKEQEKITSQT